jgi:hypothetical protein
MIDLFSETGWGDKILLIEARQSVYFSQVQKSHLVKSIKVWL